MKKQNFAVTEAAPEKKSLFERLFGQECAKQRTPIHLLFALLAIAGIAITMFLPICDIRILNRWEALIPMEAFESLEDDRMGSYIYVQLAVFLAQLVALGVGVCLLIKGLFCLHNEDKMIQTVKKTLVFGTVSVAFFTIFSLLFSPINLIVGGNCRTNVSFAAAIYIFFVILAYALFIGAIGFFRELKEDLLEKRETELRKKQLRKLGNRKIELLIYSLLTVGTAVAALLSKIMTASFQSDYVRLSDYTLSGYGLLFKPEEFPEKNERIIAFVIFTLLILCAIFAFLSLISFFSRSMYFNKIAVFSVILGSFSALLVGLMGQYYRILQQLNLEIIQRILEEHTKEALPEQMADLVKCSVKSNNICFFFGSLAVVALLFLRRPYTKAVELEKQIEAERRSKIPQTVELTGLDKQPAAPVPASEQTEENALQEMPEEKRRVSKPDFDPCPAFTELDGKIERFQRTAEENRAQVFENPTLPALVDFIVQYARNSREHLFYTQETVAAFLAGLGTTRLSILQGMSGTGKTSLPKIVAEALLSVCDLVEVESSWRDKNELLGYYNEFNKVYTPKKFTQMLYRAKLNPEAITFIVLDEMNLSRIEYYFSDFLSLMENRPDQRELKLLNTPLFRIENKEAIAYKGLVDGHTLKIPQNVWFVGTANRDESTYDISDKVYDRAHTMNFDKRAAKVQYYSEAQAPRYLSAAELTRLFEEARTAVPFSIDQYPMVAEVEKLLEPYNISFGNRVAGQMESFVSIYASCFSVTDAVIHDALEIILLSKVVRKLELKSVVDKESLAAEFDRLNLFRCSRFIRGIEED